MNNWFRAWQFFRKDRARIVLVFALMLASIGFNLLKPWPLAWIIDSLLGAKPLPSWLARQVSDLPHTTLLLVLAMGAFAAHAGQGVLNAGQNFAAIQVGLRGLRRVRNRVFACLQGLSLRFHQGARTGDIIFRASFDTCAFQTLFQQGLVTFGTASLSLVFMTLVMWRLNVGLTLAALATVPLLLVTMRVLGRRMYARGAAAQQADSLVTSLVQQNMAALPLVQSYTREEEEMRRFKEQTSTAQTERGRQHGAELLYWLVIALIFALGTAAIVWLGSRQVMSGRLTVGELIIFLSYLGQFYDPLNQISHLGSTVAGARAATGRVFELLDTAAEVRDLPDARPLKHAEGAIALEDVSFGYTAGQPVLRHVTFQLAPGESLAVIGPSGAGKSTLMNLLPRFFDPDSGTVQLDGTDLRQWRLADLRRQIAVVAQEPILLPTTLAENISYGRPEATQAEIEQAARSANAHGFIMRLPRGYETVVGEGAARLSVGERQRISLARAFLKQAPILLLDEPTSALDNESEAEVVASLFELMRGRTTLVVAHRLSTIRQVDRVLVLEGGRVLELGSPGDLRAAGGYYARVVSGQLPL